MTTEKLISSRLKADQFIFSAQPKANTNNTVSQQQRELFNAKISQADREIQNLKQKLQQYSMTINANITNYKQLPHIVDNAIKQNAELKNKINQIKIEIAKMNFNDTQSHLDQFTTQQAMQIKQQKKQNIKTLNLDVKEEVYIKPEQEKQKPEHSAEFKIKLMFRKYKHQILEESENLTKIKKSINKLDQQLVNELELRKSAEVDLERITAQFTLLQEQKRKGEAECIELQKTIQEAQENLLSIQSQMSSISNMQKLSSQLQWECVQSNQKKEQLKAKIKLMQVFIGQLDVKTKQDMIRFIDSIK